MLAITEVLQRHARAHATRQMQGVLLGVGMFALLLILVTSEA
jgi:hypothetical protein